eukprot:362355-Chlamydomonas_euryale.AAC.6
MEGDIAEGLHKGGGSEPTKEKLCGARSARRTRGGERGVVCEGCGGCGGGARTISYGPYVLPPGGRAAVSGRECWRRVMWGVRVVRRGARGSCALPSRWRWSRWRA